MGDFLVTWNYTSWSSKKTESERFIGVPEDYVDGFISGLKKAGIEGSIIKQSV